jgi:hypothetical protein
MYGTIVAFKLWQPQRYYRALATAYVGSHIRTRTSVITRLTEMPAVTLDASKTRWLTDLSRAEGPYIYRLVSHFHSHIRLHISYPFAYPFALIWAVLYLYEPLSWGISSYTNCILNGPELWGSRCRCKCNSQISEGNGSTSSGSGVNYSPKTKVSGHTELNDTLLNQWLNRGWA